MTNGYPAGRQIEVSGAAIRILRGELGDYLDLAPWPQTLTALGSWEARALQHTLAAGHLTLDDVELVPIENPWVDVPEQRLARTASLRGTDLFTDAAGHQAAVLTGGAVDTLFSWLAWGPELEARIGARLVLDLGTDARNDYATLWTVSAELVERRPEVVQALVDGVVAAGRWAAEHRAEVITQHAANLGVAESSITAGFGADFHRSLTPTLDDAALGVLSGTQTFLLDHRLLTRQVDLRRWAAPQFLTSAVAQTLKGSTA
ncbi:2'-hydroxybiphenyl-2-sulfinate desulfinase [Mycolicibacterium sp.]|uniref:2'-hydroxybiphenyl-2-sulfinate desulfinase n=1 Tax=Mycolicibacterium sp. TaxID=2320850 RepID=UPI0037CA11EE